MTPVKRDRTGPRICGYHRIALDKFLKQLMSTTLEPNNIPSQFQSSKFSSKLGLKVGFLQARHRVHLQQQKKTAKFY